MSEQVVLYEERGSVAIVTLNRPDKMNTLTEAVVQGVADASTARPPRARSARSCLRGGAH